MKKLKSCIVVDPPYDDITQMTNTEIILTSCQKNMQNQQQLVDAMLNMANDNDYYKKVSQISTEEKDRHNTAHMVQQYIDVMEAFIS